MAEVIAQQRCSGCIKSLGPDNMNWCATECVCLGAVWCLECWNRHMDRKDETRTEFNEVRQHLADALDEAALLRQERDRAGKITDAWTWSDVDSNDLNSMGDQMVVLITGAQLRRLLGTQRTKLVAVEALVLRYDSRVVHLERKGRRNAAAAIREVQAELMGVLSEK